MPISKPNLVLIHSFPTNSILLKGLIEFLSDFFNVYFIDLPGFTKQQSPLDNVTFENYAIFVEEEIKKLKLKTYIIGGISFGFIVISKMKLTNECVGIFAIEPFIGRESLSTKRYWMYTYYPLISLIQYIHLSNFVWTNSFFRKLFSKYIFKGHPLFVSRVILDEIDCNTFLETLKLILTAPLEQHFHRLPHVLFINPRDDTVRSTFLVKIFKQNVPNLLVIRDNIPHFPDDLSKEFFIKRISKNLIKETISFLS